MRSRDPIRQLTVADMIRLQEVLESSEGRPLALMDGESCLGYVVPYAFAVEAGAKSEEELISALKAAL